MMTSKLQYRKPELVDLASAYTAAGSCIFSGSVVRVYTCSETGSLAVQCANGSDKNR